MTTKKTLCSQKLLVAPHVYDALGIGAKASKYFRKNILNAKRKSMLKAEPIAFEQFSASINSALLTNHDITISGSGN